ncbi:MAG: ABC transporter ATP-binding protein/permease [Oscillospiraceae bacterium]|nr:ABC transporter ATP-binding protein/permease [Oscillospiraceae bacterium]
MNRQTTMKKPQDSKGALRRLLDYVSHYRVLLFSLLLFCLAGNVLGLIGPSMAGNAITAADAGAGSVDFARVGYYAKWMLICYLLSSLITIAVNVLMMYVSRAVAAQMRRDIFEKLMRLPVAFFDRSQAGDIISRVSYDVDVVATCISTDVVNILTSVVTVVGAFVMMVYISPLLSIVVVLAIPASTIFTAKMRKKTQPRYVTRSQKYGALNGFVEELLSGQRTVQAYAYEKRAKERFHEVNDAAAEAYYDAEYYGFAISPTINLINNASLALIAMFGALLYMYRIVTLGQISSFILYSRKFSGPIDEISSVINELFSALAAAERIFTLLDTPEEETDAPGAAALADVRGDVELRHVSFGYVPETPVLHDLSFRAGAGSLTAIVGPTGAGKTTIINLLMRFYDAQSGEIDVDDENVLGCTRGSVRRAYAMVLQDTWVFRGTIFENIAYGKPGATMDEVVQAAKAARIHSFIMQLPQGYETVISEDGGGISKGQKQLLTIARAMLYDARMLILDEATSNVDTGTERQVQQAMRTLMQGRTCFVIAHRLSTIRGADHILVLDHGDVVEQGTHAELMRAGGVYRRLYAAQYE